MKKYYIKLFICFSVMFIILSFDKTNASLTLVGKTIVVDVGHGGKDPGTSYQKILEKDINLSISKKLEIELIKYGANVVLTRDGDYDLASPNTMWRKKSDFDNRIKLIKSVNPYLFVSIHLNTYSDAYYRGAQVYYDNKNSANKELALHIQKYFKKKLNSNREIKEIKPELYLFSRLKTNGVLIECGFLSNVTDRNNLITESYQQKIASTIAEAISTY